MIWLVTVLLLKRVKRALAYSRHYPAVDWNISYSEYINDLQTWYEENVDLDFSVVSGRLKMNNSW